MQITPFLLGYLTLNQLLVINISSYIVSDMNA